MSKKPLHTTKKPDVQTLYTISQQKNQSIELSYHQPSYHQIMYLQRSIGNQVVGRLLRTGILSANLKGGLRKAGNIIQRFKTGALDYKPGTAFSSGYEAKKAIGPKSGPRYHIAPKEIPLMLQKLLDKENSKDVLQGHIEGIETRLKYWQQTFPDFKGSALEGNIQTLLSKVKTKAATAQPGPATNRETVIVVQQMEVPDYRANETTWKAWLIKNVSKKDQVINQLICKTNVITESATGKVSSIQSTKTYLPLIRAILTLQKERKYRIYATDIARALWGSGSIKADDPFRQKEGWYSELGYAVYYDYIRKQLQKFTKMANRNATEIKLAASEATNNYLDKFVTDKKNVGPGAVNVRRAFYDVVKEIVAQTKSPKIAVAFMQAMTDIMTSKINDKLIRAEIPDVHRDIRDILKRKRVATKGINEARDVYMDALNEKTKLMDKDIYKNAVQVEYIKLYIAIRQAVRKVGDAWINKKLNQLQKNLGNISTARTWVGRGVNVAWAACPGPQFALPVVLVGTIADIFLELEQAKLQGQISSYRKQLQAILERELNNRLKNIAAQAITDFASIDSNKAPKLATSVFKNIGDIEALYSRELIKALG